MMSLKLNLLAAGALIAFAGCTANASQSDESKWVASWAAAPHAPLSVEGPFAAASYDNVTLSQTLKISEGGERLRVRFSNRYGQGPLEIGAGRVFQIDDEGAEVAGTSRALTFGGKEGAIIPRGAPFVSDAVDLAIPDLARLKVEFYLPKDTGPCTCHLTGLDELAVSPPGNHVGKPFEPVSTALHRAFLTGVDIESADALGTIAILGDSITDGVGSRSRTNRRWPDVLADRLQANGQEWAVANVAISGNRILNPGMGEAALTRFDDDVLALPNVKYLIIFEGVNDLGNYFGERSPDRPALPGLVQDPISVEQMIAGYTQLVERAHAKGIKVYASPIGPYKGASYWSPEGEAARQEITQWMLNSGTFDGIIRLDTAFADPADPAAMRDGYHIGDFLHGSDAGLKAVGQSIDLSLFAPTQ